MWCQLWTMMSCCGKFATILGAKMLILMRELKQVVTQNEMWNEVMLWLTQMICYSVYIPLLIRQTNAVAENLNPSIFHVLH